MTAFFCRDHSGKLGVQRVVPAEESTATDIHITMYGALGRVSANYAIDNVSRPLQYAWHGAIGCCAAVAMAPARLR